MAADIPGMTAEGRRRLLEIVEEVRQRVLSERNTPTEKNTQGEDNSMNNTAVADKAAKDHLDQVLQALAGIAGKTMQSDSPILPFPETAPTTVPAKERRIGIPERVSPEQAVETLNEHIADQKQVATIHHEFNARFEEVMVATYRVLRRHFGTAGKGNIIQTMMGSMPPQTANFVVGLDHNGDQVLETSVPVSPFSFAPLGPKSVIHPGQWRHPQYGLLGKLAFEVRKSTLPAVEGIIKLITEEIKTASIYKGQILDLARAKDGEGYDLRHRFVRPDQNLVYNPDVAQDLQYELWGNIQYAAKFEEQGIKPTFRIGMEGMYGSGKTETAMVTARKAMEAGMTAIVVKPSVTDRISDIASAFRIAEMYAPSLLIIEDWDKFFSQGYTSSDESTITNLLDGADSKTHQVNVLWTTNNLDLIPKSMMRNGRTDCTITFGPLEREPVERMFKQVLGDQLRDDVDFDAVYEEVKDLGPSFIRGTFDKAKKYAIITNNGVSGQKLSTEDLIQAARVSRKQTDRFDAAKKTDYTKPSITDLFADLIVDRAASVINHASVDLQGDGEIHVSAEALETLKG